VFFNHCSNDHLLWPLYAISQRIQSNLCIVKETLDIIGVSGESGLDLSNENSLAGSNLGVGGMGGGGSVEGVLGGVSEGESVVSSDGFIGNTLGKGIDFFGEFIDLGVKVVNIGVDFSESFGLGSNEVVVFDLSVVFSGGVFSHGGFNGGSDFVQEVEDGFSGISVEVGVVVDFSGEELDDFIETSEDSSLILLSLEISGAFSSSGFSELSEEFVDVFSFSNEGVSLGGGLSLGIGIVRDLLGP